MLFDSLRPRRLDNEGTVSVHHKLRRMLLLAGGLAVAATTVILAGSPQSKSNVEIVGHVLRPERVDMTADRLAGLKLPPSFTITTFAQGLGKPRILAFSGNGSLYVTRRDPGDIVMLRDTDGDGRADVQRVVVRRPMLHGLTFKDTRAYFVGVTDVFVADVQADGSFVNTTRIVHDLPEAGQHADRTLRIGPDGRLYLSVGSTCNACDETSPENATMLSMPLDGSSRQVFASGLRNTIGFDWHPGTHALFGMDHGIDWLGDNEQVEELNLLEHGKQYGWPYIFGANGVNPQDDPPGEISREDWARLSTAPALGYTPHAAPMQMQFYTGMQFPAEYRGDAFVAMHGSWNRRPPSGYEVVRVRFNHGAPVKFEPFLTGFLSGPPDHAVMSGRPFGLAVGADGALFVGDDLNGIIYRVEYRK
jgi:glucose/arabinose dehydrogenase